jgi:hypothetical protein
MTGKVKGKKKNKYKRSKVNDWPLSMLERIREGPRGPKRSQEGKR